MITLNKKLLITMGLSSLIVFGAVASMPQETKAPEYKNLKVLSKKLTHRQLGGIMDQWAKALGVRCNFCHARGADGKNDFASDAKPEKLMAREMFKMTQAINKKYFHSKKDSTGVVVESNVNCYSCHRGVSHPEIIRASELPRAQRPNGQAPAGTPPPPPPTPPAGAPASGK